VSDVSHARLGGGAIVQLPCTGHPAHSAPADYTELAQTLACSLILSRIDYCNAVLHGAPRYSIKKLQCVQNNAAGIILQAPRRSRRQSVVEDFTLAARSADDRVQSGSADVQSPQHVHAGILSSPNPGSITRP